MDFLPNDIILCILSKVPLIEFYSLKRVCKGWKKMIEDIEHAFLQLQRCSPSMCRSMDNLVLIRHDNKYPRDMFCMSLANCKRSRFRPKVSTFKNVMGSTFEIVGSYNGLLCLSDRQTRCRIVVMNPLTNQTMRLPKLRLARHGFRVFSCGFGYNSDTNSYKVIAMIQTMRYYELEVMVFDCETNNYWRSVGMKYFSFSKPSTEFYSGIYLNGSLHWITYEYREIISFDLINEKLTLIQTPEDFTCLRAVDLIVFKGCLCIVSNFLGNGPNFLDYGIKWLNVWMMKQYGVENSWEIVYHQRRECDSMPWRALGEVEDDKILIKSGGTIHLFDPIKKESKSLKYQLPRTTWLAPIIHVLTFDWLRF